MRLLLLAILVILVAAVPMSAQEDGCAVNEQMVLQAVESVCANMGANEVCYGNFQVNAIARDPSVDLAFTKPGDSTSLANLRSLYLSSLSLDTNTWGIAQMRLLLTAPEGFQDVSMLLFGDVTLENASSAGTLIDVAVRTVAADILNTADPNSLVLETVDQGTILAAVGRTEDMNWLQVQNRTSRNTGWMATELVRVVDPSYDLAALPLQGMDTPYYGPMQAFYFSNGSSGNCANVATDGMLIQTPEGMARVSLLINEVSIELSASPDGEGATAFIQANPEEETGMAINVLTGEATVQTAGGQPQVVESGQQTTIALQLDLSPQGAPSVPVAFNPESIQVQSFLPALSAPSQQRPLIDQSGNLNFSLPPIGSNQDQNGSGAGSGGGISISGGTGGSSGISQSVTGGGSGSGGGSTGGAGSSSGGTTGTTDLGSLLSGGSGSGAGTAQEGQAATEATTTEGLSITNVIVLTLLVALGLGLVYLLIRYTTQQGEK
jgi:hypothetical protein